MPGGSSNGHNVTCRLLALSSTSPATSLVAFVACPLAPILAGGPRPSRSVGCPSVAGIAAAPSTGMAGSPVTAYNAIACNAALGSAATSAGRLLIAISRSRRVSSPDACTSYASTTGHATSGTDRRTS